MTNETPLTPEACAEALELTPQRAECLQLYVEKLTKWQKAINLVGPATLQDPWRRHILDSAQLASEIEEGNKVADLGSGAGFPGLVLAMLCDAHIHLVESDQRKCTFLRDVARETNTAVTVHTARIEELEPLDADIVTARALAPLGRLLPWVHRHIKTNGKAVLLKGAGVDEELTLVQKNWTMNMIKKTSLTDPDASILIIDGLEPLKHG